MATENQKHQNATPVDASRGRVALTRRGFLAGGLLSGLALAATGCSGSGSQDAAGSAAGSSAAATNPTSADDLSWDEVLAAAKGQKVSWYGWGGSTVRNNWIESVLVPRLKEQYDVELELVGMDINDILTQLSGEFQAGKTTDGGSIDFIWINGENFASAKENGYLWGPMAQALPNFQDYVDADSPEIAYDFGSKVEGYEAPYSKTQMVLWVDGAKIPESDLPTNPDSFLQFCKAHQGQVTYPEPGDFTGTAFISCLIAGVIGKDNFEQLATMSDATADEVKEIIEPGLEYLRSLNPYLWNAGSTFPADSTTCGQMYQDGELVMNMGYGEPQALVDVGTLPQTTKAFVLQSGTVGNTNYMAIAANAPHKYAAMVAINEVMSPEMQLDQYKVLGNITVLDLQKLKDDDREAIESVQLGSTMLPLQDKLAVRVGEASGKVIPIIEQLWHDEVPGK